MLRPLVSGLLCGSFLVAQVHVIRSRTERQTVRIGMARNLGVSPVDLPGSDRLGGGTTRALAESTDFASGSPEARVVPGPVFQGVPTRHARTLLPRWMTRSSIVLLI